jgi:four helix bundle protein
VRDFRQLFIWQRAHQLTLALYRVTAEFPKHEIYGLTSQIRRCAASIGANIAEGAGKDSHAEMLRFLQMAAGSGSELDNHLLLARDLGFLPLGSYSSLSKELTEVRRMMTAFTNEYRERHMFQSSKH